MNNIKYYLPGVSLIILAFVILALPEILVAFVAASIIMVGIGALYVGHMIKKYESFDSLVFSANYSKRPFWRVWYDHF